MSTERISYTASPTLARFHADDSFVRAVKGPVGSGKSTGMVFEILKRAQAQKPWAGVRRTRCLVIRNTYAELKSTTIQTFMHWIGHLGTITYDSPIRFKAVRTLPDKTIMDLEVWFLPLDREDDVKKLKSLEVTFAWINEASEVPGNVVDMLKTRVVRYPPPSLGGPSWNGIFMDTNPPATRSWFYELFEKTRPKNHKIYHQPPALLRGENEGEYLPNPTAENIRPEMGGYQYYFNMIEGADPSFISVFALGEYGQVHDGRAVYANYSDRLHCATETLVANRFQSLTIGMDWGLNPAAIITQMSPLGMLTILDEVVPTDVTFEQFLAEHFIPVLTSKYSGMTVEVIGDPAGDARNALSSKTVFELLRERGIAATPARTNDFLLRRDSVDYFLKRTAGFLLSPACSMLREGFQGGYRYAKQTERARTDPRPEKNEFSHPHDALQYVAMHFYQGVTTQRNPRRAPSGSRKPFLYA